LPFACCTADNLASPSCKFTPPDAPNDPVVCGVLGDIYDAMGGQGWGSTNAGEYWQQAASGTPIDYLYPLLWGPLSQGNFSNPKHLRNTQRYNSSVCSGGQYNLFGLTLDPASASLPCDVTSFFYLATNVGGRLGGSIPASVGNLTTLLDLSFGNTPRVQSATLSGTLPESIGSLTRLRNIYLGAGASISGTLPASLSSLTDLRSLVISGGSLSGSIPALSALTALTTLDLSAHALSGTLPALPAQLLSLLLNDNALSGDVAALSSLSSATFIALQRNALSGELPPLPAALEQLYAYDNLFVGSVPDAAAVTKLQVLDLSGNSLTGSVPAALAGLTFAPLSYTTVAWKCVAQGLAA
jgi:hypothetical protein